MASENPKGVSSRLLTMKFMQRAAASAGSTPGSDTDGHSAKKRKIAHQEMTDRRFSAHIDQALFQAANDERDAARQAALKKHAAAADTFWTLDTDWAKKPPTTRSLNVVHVGYGELDSSEEEDDPKVARTSTSDYKKAKAKKSSKQDDTDSEEGSSDVSSEEDDDNTPRGKKTKTYVSGDGSKKAARKERRLLGQPPESFKAKEFREKRKKKEVKLNKLTSISNAGDGQSQSSSKIMTCYNCQQTGHRASDCVNRGRGRSKRG